MAEISPQDGDVVVRSAHGPHSQLTFVLTPIGARWETTCRTYEEAVDAAERTAQVYKSDIWFTKDGVTFELVSSFRAAV